MKNDGQTSSHCCHHRLRWESLVRKKKNQRFVCSAVLSSERIEYPSINARTVKRKKKREREKIITTITSYQKNGKKNRKLFSLSNSSAWLRSSLIFSSRLSLNELFRLVLHFQSRMRVTTTNNRTSKLQTVTRTKASTTTILNEQTGHLQNGTTIISPNSSTSVRFEIIINFSNIQRQSTLTYIRIFREHYVW